MELSLFSIWPSFSFNIFKIRFFGQMTIASILILTDNPYKKIFFPKNNVIEEISIEINGKVLFYLIYILMANKIRFIFHVDFN